MNTNYLSLAVRAMLITLLLAGCNKAPPVDAPAAPQPTPAETPAAPADAVPAPSESVPPAAAPEPAPSPPPTPPPPTEPSAVPKPTAAEPALGSMHEATPSAKLSVPVSLRYQVEGDALPGQPITVHLAAVPRVPGARLHVEVKAAAGLAIASGPLQVEKASTDAAYRQRLSVSRSASGPDHLRVLVTMDVGESNTFGFFTIPLAGGISAQKLDSVKQR
jgi:hypothetical protein